MKEKRGRILWIDNVISELKPYVRFLEYEGYDVSLTANADEGIDLLQDAYDAVLLNPNLRMQDGTQLLSHIRREDAHIPIVLVTDEEENGAGWPASLHEADEVLFRPGSPKQLAAALTFLLEKEMMREAHTPQAYADDFQRQYAGARAASQNAPTSEQLPRSQWQAWIDTYVHLAEWELKLDALQNADELKAIHALEKREANAAFADYIQHTYADWLTGEDSPTLSVDVFYKSVIPELQAGKQVMFVIIDCMRLDQWLKIEPMLYPLFHITKDYYYSIVPTATRYARNAIFSGLFPLELVERYPKFCRETPREASSLPEPQISTNRYEKELMRQQLERHGILLKPSPHYFKIFDTRGEKHYLEWLTEMQQISLAALVVDFLDMLTHTRSEVAVLQQLIPDEAAFRTLIQAWFQHSPFYRMLRIAAERGITVVLTSDHGSVRCQNAAKISSRHKLTAGLRFKEGKNIDCTPEAGMLIKTPTAYGLPGEAEGKHYIAAKEEYYFVYEPQFKDYQERFLDSFQHGGISLEEMILPCVVLEPRTHHR